MKKLNVFEDYLVEWAIDFAIRVHEIDQKQKRKGKDVAYITHPLAVGLLLSSKGGSAEVVAAGILHDTVEDSLPEKKVTREMLEAKFGKKVADLVMSVTEENKELPWEERKCSALEHIAHFSQEALLVKSADILSNNRELIEDYKREGEALFERFNASKIDMCRNQLVTIRTIIERWPGNPFADDLKLVAGRLEMMGANVFMPANPAQHREMKDWEDAKNMPLECSVCGWTGTPAQAGGLVSEDVLFDFNCPICDKMLLIVG